MLKFSVEVAGEAVLDRAFNRFDEGVTDLRSVWPRVAEEFYAVEYDIFASEGESGASGKWAPLSPVYAKWKAVHFPDQPILRREDSLYESLTSFDALDSIFISEPLSLTIGTQREGALAHQRGRKDMPARPPISLTEADKRKLQKALQLGLVEFTRRLGFQVEEAA